MKWTALASGLVVAMMASVTLAETPELFSGGAANNPLLQRTRPFAGQNWWTRFGEPVNAAALEAGPTKGEAIDAGPIPLHGHDYIYGPGACDCPPPCIDQLWTGYSQYPKRCWAHGGLFGGHCGGCGKGCGHGCGCGKGCDKGCGCAPSCTTKADCGCAEPVTCAKAVPDCGCSKPLCGSCKHFHFGGKWKGFLAHWHKRCDSCSAPIGCGCATPLMDKGMEKQATSGLPIPLPEDAALLSLPQIN
jgi:hypothetical protein